MPTRKGKLTAKTILKLKDHEKRYGKQHVRDMRRFLRRNFSFNQAHQLALELNKSVSQNISQVVKVNIGDTKKPRRRRRQKTQSATRHQHSVSVAPSVPSQAYQQLGQLREQAVARDTQRRLNLMREQQLQGELVRANQNATPHQVRRQERVRTPYNPLRTPTVVNPDNARTGDTPQGVFRPIVRRPTPQPQPQIRRPPAIGSGRASSSDSSYFTARGSDRASSTASSYFVGDDGQLFKDRPAPQRQETPTLGGVTALDLQRIQDQERTETERKAQTARQLPPVVSYTPDSLDDSLEQKPAPDAVSPIDPPLALPPSIPSTLPPTAPPPINPPYNWRRLHPRDTLPTQIMMNLPQHERNPARTFYGLPQLGGARRGAGRPPATLVPTREPLMYDERDIFLAGAGSVRASTPTQERKGEAIFKTPSPLPPSPPRIARRVTGAPMIPMFDDDLMN